jgi:hypothetical protein
VFQLVLSRFFPAACGTFSSAHPPPQYGLTCDSKLCEEHDTERSGAQCGVSAVVGPLTPPLLNSGHGIAPHVMFTYSFVGDPAQVPLGLPTICVGHFVAAYGPLAPTQPLFLHVVRSILAALCDVDAMCTHGIGEVGWFLLASR